MIEKVIALRQELHKYPEVSNKEYKTAERIEQFISSYAPSEIINLSKTGKAFVFNGKKQGKTIVFRAELDALPIMENSTRSYSSVHKNVAHVCGHDGHMSILAGLAYKISKNPPKRGKAVLLFQPAEEVEQGAKDIVEDKKFKKLQPDYIFALHNIPGVSKHKIVLKKGCFTAASKGMTVKLYGKTSHAAEPEKGISPANAISLIIKKLDELTKEKTLFNDVILATVIHVQLGEISFGTSPGYAEIRITLRSFENNDMTLLTDHIEKIIHEISTNERLKNEIFYSEDFPATNNDIECLNYVEKSAKENQLEIETKKHPFKWSEDFGYYSQLYQTCLFGLGSGKSQPALHNQNYDFPDDIIETGINVFFNIYKRINVQNDR